ncbi:MAG: cupin domain-containing protein [Bacteroidota bacterium]
MSEATVDIYIKDVRERAVFAADGPKPQFLVDLPNLKVLVAGLEAGQQIPVHPEQAALYHFLEGDGLMTVGEETYSVGPGVTVLVPEGAPRGMTARTRLIFLGSKGCA